MPRFIADRLAAQLTAGASILTLGLTFKENVPDLRNSKAGLALELRARPRATTHDPLADRTEAQALYGLILLALLPEDQVFDAVLGAVPHRAYARLDADQRQSPRLVDVEVQAPVQFVAVLVAEEAALLLRLEIHLAEQDGVTTTAPKEGPQVTQELVRVEVRILTGPSGFDEERYGIDAEPREHRAAAKSRRSWQSLRAPPGGRY